MTNMFAQYPAGTTGTFTVKSDGSVKLDVTIPKPDASPRERKTPDKKYWVLDATFMDRSRIKDYLMACGALFGFADITDTKIYFSARVTPAILDHRITQTNRIKFDAAVFDAGWHRNRNSYRVINVRNIPLSDYPY